MADGRRALAAFDQAISLCPTFAEAWCGRGTALMMLARNEDSFASIVEACRLTPGYAEAERELAKICAILNRPAPAVDKAWPVPVRRLAGLMGPRKTGESTRPPRTASEAELRAALAERPDNADLLRQLAKLLDGFERLIEAEHFYRHAMRMGGKSATLAALLLTDLMIRRRHPEKMVGVLADFRPAATDRARLAWAQLAIDTQIARWDDYEATRALAIDGIRQDPGIADPFAVLSIEGTTADDHLAIARAYGKRFADAPARPHRSGKPNDRLRIGYVSADFHAHATAFLTAGLFEAHDRRQFRTFGYSIAPAADTPIARRVRGAFDTLVDLYGAGPRTVAERIAADGTDILIDLKGYTNAAMPGIFAQRPAPVQVSWLGFPGTLGVPYIDYIVVDPVVLPWEDRDRYDETPVYLPNCYQPNDDKRVTPSAILSRAEQGLPTDGVVFCCFNATHKIVPSIFRVWLRLLRAVPNSVLWLYSENAVAADNLRRTANAFGIDADRIVFAGRVDNEVHLARYAVADLFLDTLPYNAHTTASDALWMGCPVITCPGQTFASRVAASVDRAAGMPELVVSDLREYEALAMALARDRTRLAALREKLVATRHAVPLFDTKRFTRDLEAAFQIMWDIHANGDPPRPFGIAGSPRA